MTLWLNISAVCRRHDYTSELEQKLKTDYNVIHTVLHCNQTHSVEWFWDEHLAHYEAYIYGGLPIPERQQHMNK